MTSKAPVLFPAEETEKARQWTKGIRHEGLPQHLSNLITSAKMKQLKNLRKMPGMRGTLVGQLDAVTALTASACRQEERQEQHSLSCCYTGANLIIFRAPRKRRAFLESSTTSPSLPLPRWHCCTSSWYGGWITGPCKALEEQDPHFALCTPDSIFLSLRRTGRSEPRYRPQFLPCVIPCLANSCRQFL